jgi:orotate phosphoribosyltransferase
MLEEFTREAILGLTAPFLNAGPLSATDVERIFRACDAIWIRKKEGEPHVRLHSGRHSDGYIICNRVLDRPNLCEIMALQLVHKIRQAKLLHPSDWVLGSATGATGLSLFTARELEGSCWHPMQKGRDGTGQLFEKCEIQPHGRILQVEELITGGLTTLELRRAVRERNPHPVTFQPILPVLVYRPEPGKVLREIENSRIVSVLYYEISSWDPNDCPLCKAGSQLVSPKDNPEAWAKMLAAAA